MNIYRIRPQQKKSVVICWELHRAHNQSNSWVKIQDHYRWGNGFVEADTVEDIIGLTPECVSCDIDIGFDIDLEDSVAVYFEYSDDITDVEQEKIEQCYYQDGASWIYDGDHNWQLKDEELLILSPYCIDLMSRDGDTLETNIKY
jgi:hypothetical protein